MHTRSQRYAEKIYQQVADVATSQRPKYKAMAEKLPVLIRTAGLMQAVTFVASRGEDEHKLLIDHLSCAIGIETRDALLERSRTASLTDYMRLTQDVLAALLWYKRFVQHEPEGTKS
jgi:CRISPR-associated protein Cmr5